MTQEEQTKILGESIRVETTEELRASIERLLLRIPQIKLSEKHREDFDYISGNYSEMPGAEILICIGFITAMLQQYED